MTRPIRLFVLVNAFEADAPTRLMVEIGAGAQQSGRFVCRVAALRRTGAFERVVAARGLETRFLGMETAGNVSALARLAIEIRAFRPDIFHASLVRPTLFGVPLARWCGVPHRVITQHGIHEWDEGHAWARRLMPFAFRRIAQQASAIVAVSEATRQDLLAVGLPPAAVSVIANGVDTKTFTPDKRAGRAAVLQALGFPPDTLLIGAAGNLREIKGHRVLIGAASILRNREPRARVVVWGEGPLRASLEQAVLGAGLAGRFVLPGRAGDIAEAMAACDVFVQPSLRESFGLAAAEAMSAGVAVVASNTGGLPGLVEDGQSGLLFSTGSAEGLAVTLQYLLSNHALRRRLGAAARRRVLAFFSIERMINDYLSLYDQLVAADTLA
jgi:glycosyltransferase involved in cell wall biosynthesis